MERRLNTVPCPRCACWLIADFQCNCGEVHSPFCVHCGRWTAPALADTEHLDLGGATCCAAGAVMHEHDDGLSSENIIATAMASGDWTETAPDMSVEEMMELTGLTRETLADLGFSDEDAPNESLDPTTLH